MQSVDQSILVDYTSFLPTYRMVETFIHDPKLAVPLPLYSQIAKQHQLVDNPPASDAFSAKDEKKLENTNNKNSTFRPLYSPRFSSTTNPASPLKPPYASTPEKQKNKSVFPPFFPGRGFLKDFAS